jgi:hypothetical protein
MKIDKQAKKNRQTINYSRDAKKKKRIEKERSITRTILTQHDGRKQHQQQEPQNSGTDTCGRNMHRQKGHQKTQKIFYQEKENKTITYHASNFEYKSGERARRQKKKKKTIAAKSAKRRSRGRGKKAAARCRESSRAKEKRERARAASTKRTNEHTNY